jgi:filamentous hemagglutinin
MKPSTRRSCSRRFSTAHVLLVHAQIVLLLLTPCTQAGDILRGGAAPGGTTAVPGTAAADANAINTAAATAQARTNAQDMLARNTMALQAVTAMQDAARALAAGANNLGANPNFAGTLPDVPNGLAPGGLEIIGAPTGATGPIQAVNGTHTTVTVTQTQQQALLDWKTFNIGADTTLAFDQSAGGAEVGNWIVFNRISDPSGNPTQILGSIQAQGQVYVINQNGIIFGGGSQVNTHTLVASALPINENLIARGLLNNPSSEFLFSATGIAGFVGDVTVQTGARIIAPTSSANVGGRVALIGPNVTNNGTISTPDGQTILAAGMQVGFDAHSTDDPSLRGLDVYVGDVGSHGTATNAGLIEAPRGSVVITGRTVNQNGFIDSTTSAALNGRIDLLANYNATANINYNPADPSFGKPFVYQSGSSSGIVTTGVGSVMQILPEYASALKVVGTELALKSQINMQGLGVHLGMNSVVLAPNANVALSAGVWDLFMTVGITDLDFVQSAGQVYLDQGAVVDVAGSTAIAASITDYILTVDLRGAELADSALQRNGSLRGQTVTVDLREHGTREDGSTWVGTPLANLSGYLAVIERNVGQLTVAGGTVTIQAGEAVIMQDGAVVNVAGGYQDYGAGFVETTSLLHEGNVINIADAQADILYDGIYTPITAATDPRWGTTTGSTSLFTSAGHDEAAHSVGGSGGSVTIQAAAMALDGSLRGHTITGPQQLEAAPQLSSLALYFRAQQLLRNPLEFPFHSPTPPNIEFNNGASGLPAANAFALSGGGVPLALRAERSAAVVLSPTLLSTQGFGSLLVDNSDGNISVPAGVALTTPLTGAITFLAANVDIQGSITAPAGTIDLTAYNVSPYTTALLRAQGVAAVVPPVNPARGRVTLGAAAQLSTGGVVVDDRPASATRSLVPLDVARRNADGSTSYLLTTAGGSISMNSYIVELAVGSVLDVSGGFVLDETGGITYADAGAVTLKAGNDPLLHSLLGGHLTLGATLNGFSGAGGGDLTLQAPMIQVGGVAPHADALVLESDFFNQGGFDNFHLSGLGIDVTPPAGAEQFLPGVLITAGSVIRPQVRSLQATVDPQGGANSLSVDTLLKPEGYRPAASLLFEAAGIHDFVDSELLTIRGAVVAEAGSVIETDALGSISFDAQTVELLGSVLAPGGTIRVSGDSHYPQNTLPTTAFATVHLGATSRLSTAGKVVLLQDPYGRRTGHVYDGGSLTVSGNIVADAGAVLDVSGTSASLDLLPQQAGTANVFTAGLTMAALFPGTGVTQPIQLAQAVATQIDSNGGTLSLQGSDFLFSNATLNGHAGGSTARGGSLTVQSNRFILSGGTDDAKDITLMVAQSMASFAQPVFTAGEVIGKALVNSSGGAIQSIGYFGANAFASGGFDALTLAGNVQFVGTVDITAAGALKVADGGVLAANDLVRLTAPYVALGQPLAQPTRDEELINPFLVVNPGTGIAPSYFSPTSGSGRLEVTADLIETGFLSLQNIGQTSLTARQDLRGSGYFDVAGDLTIIAGQIYPVSASTFTITAYNGGAVTLLSSGVTPEFPWSGGGRLSIYATTISQGGTLRAPLGTITLGWDGTGTAPKGLVTNVNVPVAQQITLQSDSVTSVSAIDPETGAGVRIPYGIVKDGTNWIDPTGFDITGVGVPDKTIRVSAANVTTVAGSSIDIRGGGELYGYRWVEGNGGTTDILDTTGSFAIMPGYGAFFAPFAPFAATGVNVANLGGDPGYANSGLAVGDRIYLQATPGVAAGVYTLLPARYALLPGAMLVTPDASTLTTSQVKPDGAVLTSGYLFNSLNPAVTGRIYSQFEVASLNVVKARADYVDYTAQTFIPAAQQRLSLPASFTSSDAGYALLSALQTMQLNGGLAAAGFQTARGGRVDVSSPLDIVLAAPGAPAQPGKLLLNTTLLSGWNAESLLIGGVRSFTPGSATVAVRTTNLTVDNAGAPLTGREIILAATGSVALEANAVISQTSPQSVADNLVVTGNGALVRVSGMAAAQTSRTDVTHLGAATAQHRRGSAAQR